MYIGSTNDLDRGLQEHNDLKSQSTKSYAPFEILAYVAFNSETKARELEHYFKTGSGKAILKKRILQLTKLDFTKRLVWGMFSAVSLPLRILDRNFPCQGFAH
jgi:putative endonuclease